MVKSLGIDPGTKSFDIVLLSDGRVVWEKSMETEQIASNPEILLQELKREEGEADIIIGPSGYGVPYVCNDDIVDPKIFFSEILLLTPLYLLMKKQNDLGFNVYRALYKLGTQLWRKGAPACYIPSVKQLSTVEISFKVNKIDLGTADKLASTFIASHSLRGVLGENGINDFFLLELGFGYNALIRVKNGYIYGGLGGTSLGPGFLTAGPLDLEIVVAGKRWKRNSVWKGGLFETCGNIPMYEVFQSRGEICRAYAKNMLQTIKAGIHYLGGSGTEPVVLSGRWSNPELSLFLKKELGLNIVFTRPRLEGSFASKEAAQGMAMMGDALLGGRFTSIFRQMKLDRAGGTVMDFIYIPDFRKVAERHFEAYRKSLKKEKFEMIFRNDDESHAE
ncbi:MAG: DUF1464 family protein [Fervidicoccaceae archaeon]